MAQHGPIIVKRSLFPGAGCSCSDHLRCGALFAAFSEPIGLLIIQLPLGQIGERHPMSLPKFMKMQEVFIQL